MGGIVEESDSENKKLQVIKATASSFLPCAPNLITCPIFNIYWIKIAIFGAVYIKPDANIKQCNI